MAMHLELGANEPRRAKRVFFPNRDREGYLLIDIPAVLASGAHQRGEESELIVYLAARALDVSGSGRIEKQDVQRELRKSYPGGKLNRVFEREGGKRYWELDRSALRLRGVAAIVASYPCELLASSDVLRFSLRVLDSRPRRNAAILAAIVATGDPRSMAFIQKFSRVDSKTLARWAQDPIIVEHILRKLRPEWATE